MLECAAMTPFPFTMLPRRAAWACAAALLCASASMAQTQSSRGSVRMVPAVPAPSVAAPSPVPLPLRPSERPQVVIRAVPRPAVGDAVPIDTSVMGGASASGLSWSATTGPITDVDIARSFLGADANRDGDLTRAEASRLAIMPLPCEDMDLNRDGILSRSEYEEGVR
jgi:hypothetical protein